MKKRFSIEKHIEVGKQLKQMYNNSVSLLVSIGNAYPIKSKQTKAAKKVYLDLLKLKSVLDDVLPWGKLPDRELQSVYYGDLKIDIKEGEK